MSIPSAAIYMLGYEFLLGRISPFFTGSADPAANTSSLNLNSSTQSFPPNSTISPTSNVPHVTPSSSSAVLTPAPLIAGSLARTWSATVISPIEMFRTRLLARPTCGSDLPLIWREANIQLARHQRTPPRSKAWVNWCEARDRPFFGEVSDQLSGEMCPFRGSTGLVSRSSKHTSLPLNPACLRWHRFTCRLSLVLYPEQSQHSSHSRSTCLRHVDRYSRRRPTARRRL